MHCYQQEVLVPPPLSSQEQNKTTRRKRLCKFDTFGVKKAEAESPLFLVVYRRQSSSGTLLGGNRRRTERRWSDQASEELPSTANAAPPSYQKPQTVDIHLNTTSVRSHLKPRNASVFRRK